MDQSIIHTTPTVTAPDRHYVHKGWGYEEWFCNNDLYCGKRLHFWKDKRCSFHYHKLKDETFWVLSGKVMVIFGDSDDFGVLRESKSNIVTLEVGDTFYVPPLMRHQIIGLEETDLIEFSSKHLDEDSYRVIKGD